MAARNALLTSSQSVGLRTASARLQLRSAVALPSAVDVHRFTPPVRRRGKSVGTQAQIFRLAAQKNESRNNHKHPQGNTQSQKRAAPTVMQNEKLINQRQDRRSKRRRHGDQAHYARPF